MSSSSSHRHLFMFPIVWFSTFADKKIRNLNIRDTAYIENVENCWLHENIQGQGYTKYVL